LVPSQSYIDAMLTPQFPHAINNYGPPSAE
jgi:hypothetical protein